MERKDACSIGELLRLVIEENNLGRRLDETRAVGLWPALIGSDLASKTMRPYVSKGVMTIRVPDPALRQELSMHRSAIAAAINRHLGSEVISEIRFTG